MNDIEASIKYGVIIADLEIRIKKQAALIISLTDQLAGLKANLQVFKSQEGEAQKKIEKLTSELKFYGQTNKIERKQNSQNGKAHAKLMRQWYPEQFTEVRPESNPSHE